jgi:hypothetical protein
MRLDKGYFRFARFFNWMMLKDCGGLTVTTNCIVNHWHISPVMARSWRRTYFAARGVIPMDKRWRPRRCAAN